MCGDRGQIILVGLVTDYVYGCMHVNVRILRAVFTLIDAKNIIIRNFLEVELQRRLIEIAGTLRALDQFIGGRETEPIFDLGLAETDRALACVVQKTRQRGFSHARQSNWYKDELFDRLHLLRREPLKQIIIKGLLKFSGVDRDSLLEIAKIFDFDWLSASRYFPLLITEFLKFLWRQLINFSR